MIDLAWSPDGAILAAASAAGPVALFGLRGRRGAGPSFPATKAARTRSPGRPGTRAPGERGPGRRRQALGRRRRAARRHRRAGPLLGRAPRLAAGRRRPDPRRRGGKEARFPQSRRDRAPRVPGRPEDDLGARVAPAAAGAPPSRTSGACASWGADDGAARREFPYGNGIHALAWSPDGRWLVSGNQDPSVHLWMPDERRGAADERLRGQGAPPLVRLREPLARHEREPRRLRLGLLGRRARGARAR